MEYIAKDLLQTPRTPADLYTWVQNKIEEICSTPEGKSAFRLGRGNTKELKEEVLPLGIFAIKHYGANSEISIVPNVENKNYDAIVHGDEDGIEYIEVTQAHEGEDEYLRMLRLEEKGPVNAFGTVSKQGTKITGIKVDIESITRTHKDIRDEIFERIQQAAIRKCEKDYPAKTALVVIFDDYFLLTEKDMAELDDWIKKDLLPKLQEFALVSFISWNKRWHLEYP